MKKYIKEQLFDRILTDNQLSIEIASVLEVQQQSVLQGARRRSHRIFRDIIVIDVLKKNGLKESEIFEQTK